MKTKNTALLISLLALGSLSASAQTVTYSGSALSDLRYKPDASYVAGTPDLAVLSTPTPARLVSPRRSMSMPCQVMRPGLLHWER